MQAGYWGEILLFSSDHKEKNSINLTSTMKAPLCLKRCSTSWNPPTQFLPKILFIHSARKWVTDDFHFLVYWSIFNEKYFRSIYVAWNEKFQLKGEVKTNGKLLCKWPFIKSIILSSFCVKMRSRNDKYCANFSFACSSKWTFWIKATKDEWKVGRICRWRH